MKQDDLTPSESEWLIMEVFWAGNASMTSSEVIRELQGNADMTPKMVRVLMNRLCHKGILSYTVDKEDARLYHYFVIKSKEECLKEKSRKFVDSYFQGSQANAVAALLQNVSLTEQQIGELEKILKETKKTSRS